MHCGRQLRLLQYRLSLNGNWGVVDIDDVCSGAQFCVDNNLVDGDRLCIDGRSAGGYTTLSALTFRDVFSAGASFFGVSDLGVLCADTHKFESRYLDTLIGEYPKDKAIYDARSPIKHVEMLSCPVILLQGDDDKVVPPNQAEMMFDALKAKGIDTCLVMYQGEQHGFRMSRNIRHCLESEYTFFCQRFGYDAQHADGFDGIEMNSKMML